MSSPNFLDTIEAARSAAIPEPPDKRVRFAVIVPVERLISNEHWPRYPSGCRMGESGAEFVAGLPDWMRDELIDEAKKVFAEQPDQAQLEVR